MTGITDEGIEIDREFIAPPSAVFAAWTTPESFAQWFGGRDVVVPIDSLHFHAELGRGGRRSSTSSRRSPRPDPIRGVHGRPRAEQRRRRGAMTRTGLTKAPADPQIYRGFFRSG